MKKSLFVFLILAIILLGLKMESKKQEALIQEQQMVQVGIIVEDIEKSARAWADLLGLEKVPGISIASGSELNPTEFRGEPTDAKAKLAFFKLDNITIELIEPVGRPSTWREFLETEGEGIHHIAFNINGMKSCIESFNAEGIPMIQHGGWETGEYGYFDGSKDLGVIIELLEHY